MQSIVTAGTKALQSIVTASRYRRSAFKNDIVQVPKFCIKKDILQVPKFNIQKI